MDLVEDEGDNDSQQERPQGSALSSLSRGERLELEPGGASGETEEGPPEVKPDHRRCIVHFDIDCFYAQVEEVLDPSLRGKPVGIRQKYLMVTCNYAARRIGARKMESVIEAKRRCPSLIVVDGEDLTRYREASEAIFSYVTGMCGPMVQRLGMDEIFADVTEIVRRGSSAVEGVTINGNAHTTAPDVLPPSLRPGDDAKAAAAATAAAAADAPQSRSPAPCPGITGHLYSPGSGGTLLEAQTGLEISLHGGGSGNSGGGIVVGVDGSVEESQPGISSGTITVKTASNTECGGRNADTPFDALSANVRPGWEDLEMTQSTSQRRGKGAKNSQSNTLGSGTEASAGARCEEDARSPTARGECRCGCFDRLSIASAFAERVRRGMLETVGYTCSAGIGCSKAAAKLAGELHKPYQQTTILPEHAMSMMAQLPLRKLPGCGYSTCAKIKAELGITETRELRASPWPLLVRAVGVKLAKVLFLLCRGEDPTPVVPSVRPKTMSDEDSFKRGTVRSRAQVERHVRRLAAPLLLRARDRARLHREAPDALRFGLRRASKGHGTRVSRQCAVSSWVVTAVGDTATAAPTTAAAPAVSAETEGSPKMPKEAESAAGRRGAPPPVTGVDTFLQLPNGSASPAGGERTAEGHGAAKEGLGGQEVEGGFREARSGASVRKCSPGATGRSPTAQDGVPLSSYSVASSTNPPPSPLGHGDEALSEVVRLAMTMFDKICSPGERLDLTLLTVGFAGFRSLGGGAQAGMARYLEASQKSRRARDGEPADENGHCAISDIKKASSGLLRRGPPSAATTSMFTSNTGYSNDPLAPTSRAANRSVPAATTPAAAVTAAAGGAAEQVVGALGAARQDSPIDISTETSESASAAGNAKRLRVQGNPYPPRHQKRPRQPHEGASVLAGHTGDDGEGVAGGRGSGTRQGGGGVDWEEAEVLVVGEGGQTVPGRGRLDWCGLCRAHVLRGDMEEHASSDFHGSRLHSAQRRNSSPQNQR